MLPDVDLAPEVDRATRMVALASRPLTLHTLRRRLRVSPVHVWRVVDQLRRRGVVMPGGLAVIRRTGDVPAVVACPTAQRVAVHRVSVAVHRRLRRVVVAFPADLLELAEADGVAKATRRRRLDAALAHLRLHGLVWPGRLVWPVQLVGDPLPLPGWVHTTRPVQVPMWGAA